MRRKKLVEDWGKVMAFGNSGKNFKQLGGEKVGLKSLGSLTDL